MAIDQQIQEKVDAYRNNPEALRRNYQINQDLLDLLALQKIKTEKDAAARELQMSMGPNPGTIADQRGEEAIGRTKNDLVKQVGGVARQLEQQKQQNLQRAAAGIASQPAPNMRMAGGGIVSFANGGYQTPDLANIRDKIKQNTAFEAQYIEEDEAELGGPSGLIPQEFRSPMAAEEELKARMGINAEDFKKLPFKTREAINRQIAVLPNPKTKNELGQVANLKRRVTKELDNIVARGYTSPDELNRRAATLAPAVEVNKAGDVSAGMSAPGPNFNFETGQRITPAKGVANAAATRGFTPVTAEKIDSENIERGKALSYQGRGIDDVRRQKVVDDIRKAQNLSLAQAQRDPLAEMKAQQLQADKFQDRAGIKKIRDDQVAAIKAVNEANEAAASENRLYDLLARAGGQGAFANIGRAGSDLRQADRTQKVLDLNRVFEREDKGIADDLTVSGRSLASGDRALELGEAAKKAGLRNLTDLAKTESDNLTKDALGFLKADSENLTEGARYRRDVLGALTTNVNNQLKADIANMQGQLESDANSIRSMVAKTTNRTSLIEIADKVQNNITTISAKYDTELAKLISNDLEIKRLTTAKDMEGVEKRTDTLTTMMRDLAENTLQEYRIIEMLINKKLVGTTVGGIGSGNKKLLSTRKVTE